jgi:hypothetical protein
MTLYQLHLLIATKSTEIQNLIVDSKMKIDTSFYQGKKQFHKVIDFENPKIEKWENEKNMLYEMQANIRKDIKNNVNSVDYWYAELVEMGMIDNRQSII